MPGLVHSRNIIFHCGISHPVTRINEQARQIPREIYSPAHRSLRSLQGNLNLAIAHKVYCV